MITVECPECLSRFYTKEESAGKQTKCPSCGKIFIVTPAATKPIQTTHSKILNWVLGVLLLFTTGTSIFFASQITKAKREELKAKKVLSDADTIIANAESEARDIIDQARRKHAYLLGECKKMEKLLVAAAELYDSAVVKKETREQSSVREVPIKNGFYYRNLAPGSDENHLIGEIVNHSGKPHEMATFTMVCYDKSGKLLTRKPFIVTSIGQDESKSFEIYFYEGDHPEQTNRFEIQFESAF